MRFLFLSVAALLLAGDAAHANDHSDCASLSGDRALRACDRAIRSGRYSGPDLAEVYINRGQEFYRKGDYDRAIADASLGLRLDRSIVQGWVNRGNARSVKGQIEAAIGDYTEALKVESDMAAAYTGRAMELERRGDLKAALVDYKAALTVWGDYDDNDWAHDKARERIKALEKQ